MTSLEWWRQRPANAQVPESSFPSFDEAWLSYMIGRVQRAQPLPASLETVCVYAEDVRQGRWPDRVADEVALQSVYVAIAQEWLLGSKDRVRFEQECAALFDFVVGELEQGASVVSTPMLERAAFAQRYVSSLREDHRLFADDQNRARRHEVTLPPQASSSGASRTVTLLVLDRPVATQFKLWARRDENAALLLVRQLDGSIVLSADPAMKLKLGWLAPHLSARDQGEWYDGARHEGTLVASPKSGSRLSLEGVVEVLSRHARVPKRRPVGVIVGVVVATALAAALLVVWKPSVAAPSAPSSVAGSKGAPISSRDVVDLLASPAGPKSFERYALVAGVCGYSGERALSAPCRDARAVRALLIDKLGYRPENILFFVDRPEGEPTDGLPTAASLKLAVEKMRERYPNIDETSSFVFYYSGHGGYEKGARKDFGVLQPSGYFEQEQLPISERGWDMQELIDDVRKGVPSKHVLLLLDACYSGWAVGAKGDEALSPEVKTLWAERAEVVLSAGTKGQRAWEDEVEPRAWQWGGHSALTAFVLEGLGATGAPAADVNHDRIVTDEELASYVRQRVPRAVRDAKRADQQPQFFRFDEALPRSGQFLFLPEAP